MTQLFCYCYQTVTYLSRRFCWIVLIRPADCVWGKSKYLSVCFKCALIAHLYLIRTHGWAGGWAYQGRVDGCIEDGWMEKSLCRGNGRMMGPLEKMCVYGRTYPTQRSRRACGGTRKGDGSGAWRVVRRLSASRRCAVAHGLPTRRHVASRCPVPSGSIGLSPLRVAGVGCGESPVAPSPVVRRSHSHSHHRHSRPSLAFASPPPAISTRPAMRNKLG